MKSAPLFAILLSLLSVPALASGAAPVNPLPLDLTGSWVGFLSLALFAFAYVFVIFEEQIHLRKSKPVMASAAVIWTLIAIAYQSMGRVSEVDDAIRHNFLEYAELFFFLLVAMTYINAMIERGVFEELRNWLVARGYSYKTMFWMTGVLAFVISPIADNLTTALILCAVILTIGKDSPKFVSLGCVNIVVAANAGGAFSPFGDITTLMVWQKGVLPFWTFFQLFVPSMVNFIVPAAIMHFAIPDGSPNPIEEQGRVMRYGGLAIVGLFLATIVTAVLFHSILHIPPVFGMMTGLAYLNLYAFYLRKVEHKKGDNILAPPGVIAEANKFDVFEKIAKSEWDTLFFFYGVIMSVGGLGFIGYLGMTSEFMYGQLGATFANVLVGILSAIVDNIPVMFAVLTMNPNMSEAQWLLVTLTAGVGGSLLSIGSAAGVALMGQARGAYTFFSHLKWAWAIALGYAASILVHCWMTGII